MQYISKEHIREINRDITCEYGDVHAVLSEATLDHAVSSMQYKYNALEEREALLSKAAFLLGMLANNGHVFADGNKRTAMMSTVVFLRKNGFVLDGTTEEHTAFVLSISRDQQSLSAIRTWLAQKVKRIE